MVSALFLISFWYAIVFTVAQMVLVFLAFLFVFDLLILYRSQEGFRGQRLAGDKLSNSDTNSITIFLENRYPFQVHVRIIDELPEQFQKRDFEKFKTLEKFEEMNFNYLVRPVERGPYHFGFLNLFVSSPIRMVSRKYRFDHQKMTAVYPSYIQMKKYEFLAMNNKLTEFGLKKIRRIGHTMEFEQIKEYISGDDVRTINWKATAKKGSLMVNQYQDEKSQPIYSLIDVGRVMKMPFESLKLLDYAINATLAFSNIALLKNDKVGMLTFSKKVNNLIASSNKKPHLSVLNESLYRIDTDYSDSDFALLYATIKGKINQRSLLILYTNFEHISALRRQLPYMRAISKQHLLVVVFFENTELDDLIEQPSDNLLGIYNKTIAEKFSYEKRLIVKELESNGVYAILTQPKNLSVTIINKYLEFKAKGLI
ncbi:MAG: DUF58 domain-containing protein [Flavobacteriaceae bacterium]|nr:MAG: DUF58 domain-containing protein [Flavobacteriaceae bacterium]